MFCSNCGNQISDDSKFCPECGAPQDLGQGIYEQYNSNENYTNNNYGYSNSYYESDVTRKSRLVAGLLQIFLGAFGVGRFYLGYNGIALGQLFTTFLCGIGVIWSFIDGILILCGRVEVDGKGIPLRD